MMDANTKDAIEAFRLSVLLRSMAAYLASLRENGASTSLPSSTIDEVVRVLREADFYVSLRAEPFEETFRRDKGMR